jgi:UDP-glucose 4-epimerase
MSERYLVTGGAGFIGSNLVEALVEKDHKVRVLDNFSTGKRANLAHLQDKIELITGDIRYLNTVLEVMKDVDYVLHQAALPSVPRSIETPLESNDVNINGTLNILYAAKQSGVKRVVYAASSSAYGDTPTLPKVETMKPNPISPYAVNKLAGEQYCQAFYRVYGLETVALRYFNIFGRRQDPASYYSAVIPKFIRMFMDGQAPLINGDGSVSRDFTYIDNVIHANLLACKAPKAAGQVFNIACGQRITLTELTTELKKLTGAKIDPVYGKPRPGDVQHSLADINLAKELLGYTVQVNVFDGLKRTADWFMTHKEALV